MHVQTTGDFGISVDIPEPLINKWKTTYLITGDIRDQLITVTRSDKPAENHYIEIARSNTVAYFAELYVVRCYNDLSTYDVRVTFSDFTVIGDKAWLIRK